MDVLSQHEAFLRAIFDAPDDDTPRLVYADFLQEQGEEDRAELIRVQCELDAGMGNWNHSDRYYKLVAREDILLDRLHPEICFWEHPERERIPYSRGFLSEPTAVICPGGLENPEQFRRTIVRQHPHWFGCSALAIQPGWYLHPDHVAELFGLAFGQRIADWDLSGDAHEDGWGLGEIFVTPSLGSGTIDSLAQHPGSVRITTLNLTNNGLRQEEAQALIRSPHLVNLRRLTISDGNSLDDVLGPLAERFGINVVV